MRSRSSFWMSICLIVLSLIISACSGGDGPSAPTAPAVTATAITVTLSDTLAVGATAQATATATMTNGQTQAIASGFLSDTPSVATVTDGGLVTAVSQGRANIYVLMGGKQGLKQVRTIANFQGNWSGRYMVTACSNTGIFLTIRGCSGIPPGTTAPLTLVLTQTGESVSGRVAFGSLNSENVTVPVGGDGSIRFVARVPGDPQIDVNLNLSSPAANQITGGMHQTWRFLTRVGDMQLDANIIGSLNKTSGIVTPMALTPNPNGAENRLAAILGR